ncbi:MAG: AbrB/MazE/SpoVT family DNA-binding domain-containing protein [Spirochaetes bacterium]|jgi:bifunctional DNA-binding transcriptional regulator/antitoxin component of YhaV-PrlF toxin-antitoxin module|nr:AbrB/MazE/SpoVT family DNA-binding domain-containing protein [Spirochaetota bacterium]
MLKYFEKELPMNEICFTFKQSNAINYKKGQVTIPQRIRDILATDVIEFKITSNGVYVHPVKSVAGNLKHYAKHYEELDSIRDKVREDVVKNY